MADLIQAAIIGGAFGVVGALLTFLATRKNTVAQIEDNIWKRAKEMMAIQDDRIDKLKMELKDERVSRKKEVAELHALLTKSNEENDRLREENHTLREGKII